VTNTSAPTPTPLTLRSTIRLTLLDIVTARHAHTHLHGAHVSPIFGCYLCLHGVRAEATEVRELRAAA
jgi:hypothetical protein